MGRSFQADDAIESYIEQLIKSGQWHVGVIVGQLTNNKDFVVRIIRTPDPTEDEVSEEEEGEEVVPAKKTKTVTRPKSLDLTADQWVATHAKQVDRMLCGGLNVIGMFALAPPNMMQSAQAKLRQVLFAVHKTLSKMSVGDPDDGITDRLLLQICSVSKKLTCKTFDVDDLRSTARPAEWKYMSGLLDRWSQLTTSVSVDLVMAIPKHSRSTNFLKQIQQGIQPFCDSLYSSTALVDGVLRNSEDQLDVTETKKGKSKDRSQVPQIKHDVELLASMSNIISTSTEPVLKPMKAILKIKGLMVGRSFINNKATVEEAIKAVKSDMVRSLVSRCELLCDDLEVVENDDELDRELYNTPVRVFAHPPNTAIDFCDYMFQDEKIHEVSDRLKELLDIDVTEDDMELQCEKHAEEEDWSNQTTSALLDEESTSSSNKSNLVKYLSVAASGVAVAIAGAVYMAFGES